MIAELRAKGYDFTQFGGFDVTSLGNIPLDKISLSEIRDRRGRREDRHHLWIRPCSPLVDILFVYMAKKTVVLAILDGWGIGKNDNSNPIYEVNPQNINYIKHNYPSGSLQASGIAVGLPWGEEGNSEVGHLTLGAGKILYQHFPRISLALKNGDFFKNEALLKNLLSAKEKGAAVNLIGEISEGNVHASIEHLIALIKMAQDNGIKKLNLHLITDGRDSGPNSAGKLIERLGNARIASLSGRYFAMDRDSHLDRTEKAYNAMTGVTKNNSEDYKQVLDNTYSRGLTDEFSEPTLLLEDGAIKDNDSVIFFNFREDSIRELVQMFLDSKKPLEIATFTEYSEKFGLPVAFPQEKIKDSLGRILSDNGKVQLRIAETEKYAHITYFFNGFVEPPMLNEYRTLIPSKNIARHDEAPEMRAQEITLRVISAIEEGIYDFILINYANADVIAHTGNYKATETAIKTMDEELGKLMKAILKTNSVLIITSDHGNAEKMIDAQTGLPDTKHNPNPVPIYIVANGFERQKNDIDVREIERESVGVISDVAPTILEIMSLAKPESMTGTSLVRDLR